MISCVPCETLLWPCPATFSLAWIWQNFHSYNIFLWCNCTTETKFSYASQVSKDRSCFTSFPMRNPPLFIPCWEAAQITDAAYHSSCRPCGKCALLLSYILHTQKKKNRNGSQTSCAICLVTYSSSCALPCSLQWCFLKSLEKRTSSLQSLHRIISSRVTISGELCS